MTWILFSLLMGCPPADCDDTDHDSGTDAGTDTDTGTDTDSSGVDYPDYPTESGNDGEYVGVLLLDSDDGPLGDVTYLGSPRATEFDEQFTSFYTQTDELVTDQPEITYRLNTSGLGVGEHTVSGEAMYVYSETDLEYLYFDGSVLIDELDLSGEAIRYRFVGTVSGDPGTSTVRGAVDVSAL